MTQQLHFSNSKFNQAISTEQLNQIVEAILAGKYSWACVLLLRCAGYNPLHYIPYRTYNRLLKENGMAGNSSQSKTVPFDRNKRNTATRSNETSSHKNFSNITDLTYLEEMDESSGHVKGGSLPSSVLELLSFKFHLN